MFKNANNVVAIRETETRSRYFVAIESDIATGKVYAYNPEVGFAVITPYKDRDAIQTKYIKNHPYPWMIKFDVESVKVPENWMD